MIAPFKRPLDGSAAPNGDQRLLEVIFGVEGACEDCLPRRVPATRVVKVRVVGPKILEGVGEDKPYENEYFLCAEHAQEAIDSHLDPAPPEERVELVEVRDL